MNPAIMYAKNTAESAKKTLSAFLNVPRSTKYEMTKPVMGTVTYRETPNNCPAAATPANSAVIVPKFAKINETALNEPARAPYF